MQLSNSIILTSFVVALPQTLGQIGTGPLCPPKPQTDCTQVEVYGDANYCVEGLLSSSTCAFTGEDNNNCPQVGEVATGLCLTTMTSYDQRQGTCILAENTVCASLPDGNYGCVPASSSLASGDSSTLNISTPCILIAAIFYAMW